MTHRRSRLAFRRRSHAESGLRDALALLAVAALALGGARLAGAAAPPPDHLLCYAGKPLRGVPLVRPFVPQSLSATDRLGGPIGIDVKKPLVLCHPADVNGADATAPARAVHAVGYQGKRAKGSAKFDRKGGIVEVRNQFHAAGLALKLAGEDRLLAAASLAPGDGGAPPAPPGAASFKCYKVKLAKAPKGQPPFPPFVPPVGVSVTDAFLTRLLDFKKPLRLCHPLLEAGAVLPVDDDPTHLVCYAAKLAKSPKQAKPARQVASVQDALGEVVLATQTAAEVCVPSAVDPSADVLIRFVDRVEAQLRMANENFPVLLRPAIEAYYPEIVALIAEGPAAVDRILAELVPPADLGDDIPLVLLTYALERIGDPRAVPVLAEWLRRHVFAELVWAPEFATHALKVLSGQGGLDTTTFTYGIDEKLDAIAQAIGDASAAATLVDGRVVAATAIPATGAATTAAPAPPPGGGAPISAAARPLVLSAKAPPPGDCTKRITVRGTNALGQPDEVAFNYTVVARDIDQRIAEEPDPGKRRTLIRLRDDEYLKPDQQTYDGTSYVAVPGATVSARSNCGGSVTERVLNAVAMQKGLPLLLGEGRAAADDIREVARRFGTEVPFHAIDRATVISHDRTDGTSAHVEVPLATTSGVGATIFSKDNFGIARTHQVSYADDVDAVFAAPIARYGTGRSWNPFSTAGAHFYKVDPARVSEILVDSSACPCRPDAAGQIPVAITHPAEAKTAERVLTVQGTVGDPGVTAGTLRVNGSPQAIAVAGGAFAATVVLKNGPNALGVTVDAPDGRRGCSERAIESTAPRTTISATLTWNLDRADVDLYVTQPDGETSWYGQRMTSIGGLLDVDNVNGLGPENYFLTVGGSGAAGAYTVRVHYYDDHLDDEETPTRPAGWRVVVVVNEGTSGEQRFIQSGSLAFASSANDAPGSFGSDWATAIVVTIPES